MSLNTFWYNRAHRVQESKVLHWMLTRVRGKETGVHFDCDSEGTPACGVIAIDSAGLIPTRWVPGSRIGMSCSKCRTLWEFYAPRYLYGLESQNA